MYRYFLALFVCINCAFAAGPDGVNYQGYLQNSDGSPVSGSVNLQFAVWDSPSSTSDVDRLYVENHANAQVTNGLFTVELGAGTVQFGVFNPDLFSENNRWLETIVDGEALTPRTKFLSVPYALQARQADSLSGMSGAVMHFALSQCPPGWSELIDARGRTLVGLPANGTLTGISSGAPLTDLENRQHDHAVTSPGVATTFAPSHSHTVFGSTTTTDTHNHRWSRWDGSLRDWISFSSSGNEFTITNWSDGMDQAGSGIYPVAASSTGTTTIYTDNDSHNHSTSSSTSGSGGSHNHTTASVSATSSSANSNPTLPYMQLLVCMKN